MNLSCPVCNRDYEIPRRSVVRVDDIEFIPCPRVLPCLHTVWYNNYYYYYYNLIIILL